MPRLFPAGQNPLLQTTANQAMLSQKLRAQTQIAQVTEQAKRQTEKFVAEAKQKAATVKTALDGLASSPTVSQAQFYAKMLGQTSPQFQGIQATKDNLSEIQKTVQHILKIKDKDPLAAKRLIEDNSAGLGRFKNTLSGLNEQVGSAGLANAAKIQGQISGAQGFQQNNQDFLSQNSNVAGSVRSDITGLQGRRVDNLALSKQGQDVLAKELQGQKAPASLDATLAKRVQNGELTLEQAFNLKKQGTSSTTVNVGAGESELLKTIGRKQGEAFIAAQGEAQKVLPTIQTIRQAKKLLDGGVITGTGANAILGFDKLISQLGFEVNGRKIANTEAFAGITGNLVGSIIKQFGAGTGLSDADREFARKIAGSDITLNESSIRRLLDIAEKANIVQIKQFNKRANKLAESHKGKISASDFLVDIPEIGKISQSQTISGATSGGNRFTLTPVGQ